MMQETEDERIQKQSNRIIPEKEGIHGDHGKENSGSGCLKQLDMEWKACVQGWDQKKELRETVELQCQFVQGFSPASAKDIKRKFSE